jgi:hypothetical protein
MELTGHSHLATEEWHCPLSTVVSAAPEGQFKLSQYAKIDRIDPDQCRRAALL